MSDTTEVQAEQPPAEGQGAPDQGGEGQGGLDSAQDQAQQAQAAVDQAQQKRGESDQDFEVRMSRLKMEARRAREQVERTKAENTKLNQELEQLRAAAEKAKGRKGITRAQYLRLHQAILGAGDDEAKILALFDEDEAEVPAAVREKLEALERSNREREERERRGNYQQARAKEEAVITGIMKELVDSDECPLYEAFPGYAGEILNQWYAEWRANGMDPALKPDPHEVAQRLHKAVADDLVTALQSERARSFLFRLKPELKALLGGQETRVGGPTRDAQGAGRGNGPAAKTTPPTVQRPPSASAPAASKHPLQAEEEELDAARAAYREYQLSLQQQR